MSPPAVVLGGQVSGLAVARSLGAHGIPVIVTDPGPGAPAFLSRFTTRSQVIPDPRMDEDGALRALLAIGRTSDRRPVLVPTADHWAILVADHRDELSELFVPPPAETAVIRSLLNKRRLFDLARRAGVPTPETVELGEGTPADAIRRVGSPCLVKPAEKGDFVELYGRAAVLVSCEDELRARMAELGSREVVVQEYLRPEVCELHTAAVFIDRRGRVAATFGGRRLAVYPAEFGTSALVASKIDPECEAMAVALLQEAGYRGLAEVEFIRNGGAWKLIDANPRCWKWIGLTSRAGVDLPWLLYRDAVGEPLPPVRQREGVRWVSSLDLVRLPAPGGPGELTNDEWSQLMGGSADADLFDAIVAHDDMEPWLTMLRQGWGRSGIACAC